MCRSLFAGRTGPVRSIEPAHIIQVCCLSHLFRDIQTTAICARIQQKLLNWCSPLPLPPHSGYSLLSDTCRFLLLHLLIFLSSLSLAMCEFRLHKLHPKCMLPQRAVPCPAPVYLQLVRGNASLMTSVWSGYLVLDKLPAPLIGIDPEAVFAV